MRTPTALYVQDRVKAELSKRSAQPASVLEIDRDGISCVTWVSPPPSLLLLLSRSAAGGSDELLAAKPGEVCGGPGQGRRAEGWGGDVVGRQDSDCTFEHDAEREVKGASDYLFHKGGKKTYEHSN